MLPDKKQTAAKSGAVIGSLTALGLPSEPSQGLGTDLLGRFHDRASQKTRVVRAGERDQEYRRSVAVRRRKGKAPKTAPTRTRSRDKWR